MIKAGLIVNPYAGLGGAVGLKGTDGCIREALERGAVPEAPSKALRFLANLAPELIFFYTASGKMGEEELEKTPHHYNAVYISPLQDSESPIQSDRNDTINACQEMIKRGVDIILFCGGDGTAQDIYSCTRDLVPILGIPAGVKIYSGVFGTTPEAVADILSDWNGTSLTEGEVMDVDEAEYRKGILNTNLFGYAKIPASRIVCQSSKAVSSGNETRAMVDIASFIIEIMQDDTLYLLGAGTTTRAIADSLSVQKTLLGIDAIYKKSLIAQDLNESDILHLLDKYSKVRIIISPIGAQGFILGRGNQQISSKVIRKTGTDALIVVATEAKIKRTRSFYIDTGDLNLNNEFGNSIQIICGYRMAIRTRLCT